MFVVFVVMSFTFIILFNLPKNLLVRWDYLIIQHLHCPSHSSSPWKQGNKQDPPNLCLPGACGLIGEADNKQVNSIISDVM